MRNWNLSLQLDQGSACSFSNQSDSVSIMYVSILCHSLGDAESFFSRISYPWIHMTCSWEQDCDLVQQRLWNHGPLRVSCFSCMVMLLLTSGYLYKCYYLRGKTWLENLARGGWVVRLISVFRLNNNESLLCCDGTVLTGGFRGGKVQMSGKKQPSKLPDTLFFLLFNHWFTKVHHIQTSCLQKTFWKWHMMYLGLLGRSFSGYLWGFLGWGCIART